MTTLLRTSGSALARAEPAPANAAVADPSTAARIHAALEKIVRPERLNAPVMAAGIAAWVAFAAVARLVPDSATLPLANQAAIDATTGFAVVVALAVALVWTGIWALARTPGRLGAWSFRRASHGAAWLLGSGAWFLLWELSTAKTEIFAPPYFAAPQEILHRLWEDRGILGESLTNSILLLAVGFLVGLLTGLGTGVWIGWSRTANYWVHPVLMFIGPVPSLAWVPVAFVLFPTPYAAAVFMIALTVWFPIAVLTRAGIQGVPRSYHDVAQTLGADTRYLLWCVSLPAALPSIFTGAFMALGGAFVSLTVAENFGVNAGLGWYLNWQKGWGDFPAVYAGIVVLVVVCGVLLTLLLQIRGYVLRWEKELTRW